MLVQLSGDSTGEPLCLQIIHTLSRLQECDTTSCSPGSTRAELSLLIVRASASSAVQLGNHKGQKAAPSCVGHFGLAQVLPLSLP
jgi:hypothetical protein